jgi:hypothetical protein
MGEGDMNFCKCGCGQLTSDGYLYVKCHSSRITKHFKVSKPCDCGCGLLTKKGNSFIHGHNRQGFLHTDDEKRRIKETNLKTYSNQELIEKFKGANNPYFGAKTSDTVRAILKAKSRERCSDPAFIQKIATRTKAALSDPAKREKIRVNSIAMWKNKESQERLRIARNAKPNKPESFLCKILDEMYPGQWRYTGDLSLIIDGKCPDFVNCNGQKKIIEFWGDYWHKGQNPQDRIDTFKPFGFDTLVIWEHEL